jgi:hypothetical protein
MKKFVVGLVFIKAVFLFSLALVSCQTAELSKLESQVAASPTATPTNSNESINRPTSEPYTGDLSIFEVRKPKAKRDSATQSESASIARMVIRTRDSYIVGANNNSNAAGSAQKIQLKFLANAFGQ